MRTEVHHITPLAPPLIGDENPTSDLNTDEVAAASLKAGIQAAQSGDRATARREFLRVTELAPQNEAAWLWLSSISEYPEELLVFLNKVLEINPDNERAIEWKRATNSLLAKTFVQCGIDAANEGQRDFAIGCFQRALDHDLSNEVAWLWLASLAGSDEERLGCLERVLNINPENIEALEAHKNTRESINRSHLQSAKAAVLSGNRLELEELLSAILGQDPNNEEAWLLRSHFAESFEEKTKSFEQVLRINPANAVAMVSLDSLGCLFSESEQAKNDADKVAVQADPKTRPNMFFVEGLINDSVNGVLDYEHVTDKNPTQDLELPEHIAAAITERDNFRQLDENHFDAVTDSDDRARQDPNLAESTRPHPIEQPAEVESSAFFSVHEDKLDKYASRGFAGLDLAQVLHDQTNDPEVAPNGSYNSGLHQNEDQALGDPYQTAAISLPNDSMNSSEVECAGTGDTSPETRGHDISDDETHIVDPQDENEPAETHANGDAVLLPESVETHCPFCKDLNEPNSEVCGSCMAILSLSDIEKLIDNQNADTPVLRLAVDEMESQRGTRNFDEATLVNLGIGHLNLRNLQYGFECLQRASKLNPDNAALAERVNALRSRIEEVKSCQDDQDLVSKGKTILVVDDSPTVRKLIAEKLKSSGHTVFCSADGVEALKSLENTVPDLILIDINMPTMDGYQACSLIRNNPATKNVPIIMVSGKDGPFDEVRGKMVGTTGYITKPFGPETLMKTVETYLSREVPDNAE
jgi:twitching motility two-component system response regulator PilG